MRISKYMEDENFPIEREIIDEEWLEASLNANIRDYDEEDLSYLYYSGVLYETMDTSLGGHLTLNPPYGFTPGADSYYKGAMRGRVDDNPLSTYANVNIGMGRKYYEYIQTNSNIRTLSLSFGIPEFQGILSYMAGAIDYGSMIAINEGRSPDAYYLGKAIGIGAAIVANPIFTATFYILKGVWNIAFGESDPRFYHMKPTMHHYYMSLNNLMQLASSERGFTSFDISSASPSLDTNPTKVEPYDKEALHKAMPNVFDENGFIDVLSISSRYQVLLSKKAKKESYLAKDDKDSSDYIKYTKSLSNGAFINNETVTTDDLSNLTKSLSAYKAKLDDEKKVVKPTPTVIDNNVLNENKEVKRNSDGSVPKYRDSDWLSDAFEYYKSAIANVSDSIFLQVEYIEPGTDSFSNSTKEMPVKEYFNSTSSAFRDVRFTLAGTDLLTQGITDAVKNVRDVAYGVLDGASFGITNILHTLLGGGYVDLPIMWDDSTANMAEHDFKITINNPYSNPVSLLMDIDLVVYAILAGMLPRQMGRAAYGSPFLCKAFMQGKLNVDFGMITECSVVAGDGKMGINSSGVPSNVTISFKIKEFNTTMAAPFNSSFIGSYKMAVDDYSMINKYVRKLSGSDYSDSHFIPKRIASRLGALAGDVSTYLNVDNMAFLAGSARHEMMHRASNILNPQQSGIWQFNEDF